VPREEDDRRIAGKNIEPKKRRLYLGRPLEDRTAWSHKSEKQKGTLHPTCSRAIRKRANREELQIHWGKKPIRKRQLMRQSRKTVIRGEVTRKHMKSRREENASLLMGLPKTGRRPQKDIKRGLVSLKRLPGGQRGRRSTGGKKIKKKTCKGLKQNHGRSVC